jgi:RHS repeat-associated protein
MTNLSDQPYERIDTSRRYVLGEVSEGDWEGFGIWDRLVGNRLVERFPPTEEGIDLALERFNELKWKDRRERWNRYESYGQLISSTGSTANPFRFASGYLDSQVGWLKFGTRYYEPGIARWTQKDPLPGGLGDPSSMNLYSYTACDPVNATDPTGLVQIGGGFTQYSPLAEVTSLTASGSAGSAPEGECLEKHVIAGAISVGALLLSMFVPGLGLLALGGALAIEGYVLVECELMPELQRDL